MCFQIIIYDFSILIRGLILFCYWWNHPFAHVIPVCHLFTIKFSYNPLWVSSLHRMRMENNVGNNNEIIIGSFRNCNAYCIRRCSVTKLIYRSSSIVLALEIVPIPQSKPAVRCHIPTYIRVYAHPLDRIGITSV